MRPGAVTLAALAAAATIFVEAVPFDLGHAWQILPELLVFKGHVPYTESLQDFTHNSHSTVLSMLDDSTISTIDLNVYNQTITTLIDQTGHFTNAISDHGVNTSAFFADVSTSLEALYDLLKAEFPPPDEALGHEERVAATRRVLSRAEEEIVVVAANHNVEDKVRIHMDAIRPHIEQLIVVTGDLIEQHPKLLSTLLLYGATWFIPESWLLSPLLRLFGFGLYGPVKGSPAAWAQRYFWGGRVAKGSWFSFLQSLAMKNSPIGFIRRIWVAIFD